MKKLLKIIILAGLIGGLYTITSSNKLSKLPSYNALIGQTSVSGLSSGAYMAEQFQMAHSGIVVGAGIVAGGPYYCAGSFSYVPFVTTALTTCMNPVLTPPNGAALADKAKGFAQPEDIDDVSNLKKQRVYLFGGMKDDVVAPSVVDQTAAFYRRIGVPNENIKYINNVNAGHAFITNGSKDNECASTASPYINNCHFMQAHDILRHIYGNLNPPVTTRSGKMIKFDQSEFDRSSVSSMGRTAYAYVPKSCETQQCKVHIVFHGCAQGVDEIGDRFIETAGYNEIADTNNMIVLYPQVKRSSVFPVNTGACWDFWGYSSYNQFSPNFYTKRAPQIAAVAAMLTRLEEPRKN